MKRALGFLLLILFLTGSRTLAQIKDYYYKNFQNLGNFQQQSSRSSALILSTPIQGTVNMAIILCVEKGQPRNFSISTFINNIKDNCPFCYFTYSYKSSTDLTLFKMECGTSV